MISPHFSFPCSLFFGVFCMITCQELTLVQSPSSITRPLGKTAKLLCVMDGESVINRGLHWYHQRKMEPLTWVLYYKPGQLEVSEDYKDRVSLEPDGDKSCTLSITNIRVSDDSMYYCASWHRTGAKYFGTGTRLVVIDSNSPVKEAKAPKATILASSPAEIEQTGKLIYLCHLRDFFPEVIRVTWTEEGKTTELEAMHGEVAQNLTTKLCSIRSWLTVSKADLMKRYVCNYQHEGIRTTDGKGQIITRQITTEVKNEPKKPGTPEGEISLTDCTHLSDNSTKALRDIVAWQPYTLNAAYLTYILLLLKSAVYSIIIIYFLFRVGVISLKKESKKAP